MIITDNEKKLLLAFAYCEMNTCNSSPEIAENANELGTYVWLDEREVNGLNIRQMKGVLGSLVKKELVVVDPDFEHDTVDFTDLGFETVMKFVHEKEAA